MSGNSSNGWCMVRTVCSAAVDNKTKVTSTQQLNKCQGRERNAFVDEREASIASDYCVKLFHLEWAKTNYEANNNILIITIFSHLPSIIHTCRRWHFWSKDLSRSVFLKLLSPSQDPFPLLKNYRGPQKSFCFYGLCLLIFTIKMIIKNC